MDNIAPRRDKLAFASEAPDILYLCEEYERSIWNGGNVARFNDCDNIRLSRWDSQSEDGKKWSENMPDGQQAFPFEGASDVRNRLIDRIINELVSIAMTSWQRSQLRISGVEVNDAVQAGAAHTLMKWIIENKIRAQLEKEFELWLQYTLTYGWAVMHVGWEQRLSRRSISVSLEDIQTMGLENPAIEQIGAQLASGTYSDILSDLIVSTFGMTKKEAGKFIKEIGKNGKADIFESFVSKNLPVVAALKPYDEFAVPPETLDLQDARVTFKRQFMSEVELRSTALAEGWDEEFVEEACNTEGRSNFYEASNLVPVTEHLAGTLNRSDNLIEIVYAYSKQISENGTPCIFYTVFCPNVRQNIFAIHDMLDYAHGEYPFIDLRQETIRRSMCETRGIPEIAMTDQEEIKAQHDSIRDRTAFETLPPVLVKKRNGTMNRIGPGVLLPILNKDDYSFMPPPSGTPQLAFNLIDRVEIKLSEYFGLYHPAVPQIKTQTKQQFFVNKFLTAASQVYRQMFSLTLQYMPSELIERVSGVAINTSPAEAHDLYDFSVRFDIRELDVDWNIEKMKAISQFVLPMDSTGVIDRSKMVQRLVEAISPDAARDILVDQRQASQKTYDDMQTEVAKMLMGIEPRYPENDPQAEQKMQAMQEIVGKSQKAQQMISQDPQSQAIYQNYLKSLQMSVMQEKNKVIGRTGVTPVSDEMMQGQAQQPGMPMEGQLPMGQPPTAQPQM